MKLSEILDGLETLRKEESFVAIEDKLKKLRRDREMRAIRKEGEFVYEFPAGHPFSRLNGESANITKVTADYCIVNIDGRVVQLPKKRLLPVVKDKNIFPVVEKIPTSVLGVHINVENGVRSVTIPREYTEKDLFEIFTHLQAWDILVVMGSNVDSGEGIKDVERHKNVTIINAETAALSARGRTSDIVIFVGEVADEVRASLEQTNIRSKIRLTINIGEVSNNENPDK